MKLYRLSTWSHGQKFYVAGVEQPQFVKSPNSGRLYTRKQADELRRRFAKFKQRLKLEIAA